MDTKEYQRYSNGTGNNSTRLGEKRRTPTANCEKNTNDYTQSAKEFCRHGLLHSMIQAETSTGSPAGTLSNELR